MHINWKILMREDVFRPCKIKKTHLQKNAYELDQQIYRE